MLAACKRTDLHDANNMCIARKKQDQTGSTRHAQRRVLTTRECIAADIASMQVSLLILRDCISADIAMLHHYSTLALAAWAVCLRQERALQRLH